MAKAVSNSSPLIHLAAIDRLSLLQDSFDEVIIPHAVWREVVEEGRGRPGASEVCEAVTLGWMKIVTPTDDALVRLLRRDLDDGEAEAIALAVEQAPVVILLDESEARIAASTFSLRKTGTVGLLIRAKHAGRIVALKPELDRLRDKAGFWIHDELYRRALVSVNEATG